MLERVSSALSGTCLSSSLTISYSSCSSPEPSSKNESISDNEQVGVFLSSEFCSHSLNSVMELEASSGGGGIVLTESSGANEACGILLTESSDTNEVCGIVLSESSGACGGGMISMESSVSC